MSTETTRYSIFQDGMDLVIEGGLGNELEVKETNGKKYLTLSIAVDAGSKKDDNGEYVKLTDWNQITIWEWNGGNAKDLINFVLTNTNDKIKFYKGNKVKLKCTASKVITNNGDKTYVNWNVHKFYDLTKAKTNNGNANTTSNSTDVISTLQTDDF